MIKLITIQDTVQVWGIIKVTFKSLKQSESLFVTDNFRIMRGAACNNINIEWKPGQIKY